LDFSEVLSFAGGRIWRGDTALELGLVDKLGSLDGAVDSMVSKLELEDLLPIEIQGFLKEFNGLKKIFLCVLQWKL